MIAMASSFHCYLVALVLCIVGPFHLVPAWPVMSNDRSFRGAIHFRRARWGRNQPHPQTLLTERSHLVVQGVSSPSSIGSSSTTREVLKQQLLSYGIQTKRGFQSSTTERKKIQQLLYQLAFFNPTPEPAEVYYNISATSEMTKGTHHIANLSLTGRWNMIYTDAPDIISLRNTPPALIELGRIGQDCTIPNTIMNVIEWVEPQWIRPLLSQWDAVWANRPATSSTTPPITTDAPGAVSRILQKIITTASSQPSQPTMIQLRLVGVSIDIPSDSKSLSRRWMELLPRQSIRFPPTMNQTTPGTTTSWMRTSSPSLTLGEFEVLYLDEDLKVTRTGQGYYIVSQRIREEMEGSDVWF